QVELVAHILQSGLDLGRVSVGVLCRFGVITVLPGEQEGPDRHLRTGVGRACCKGNGSEQTGTGGRDTATQGTCGHLVCSFQAPQRRTRTASFISCFASRSAIAWRLSYSRLPRAWASSTLARPSLKYSDRGTRVRPGSCVFPINREISPRCRSSLRDLRAAWFVHVPWVYSGMWTFSNHTSPSWMWANPSTSEALPCRSDFTSVPVRTRPAS